MLLRIRHETIYRYGEPAKIGRAKAFADAAQLQHSAHRELAHRGRPRLPPHQREDAFGNILHCFTADGPFDTLTTLVEGEVETFDTAGVVSGAVERFPPALYLRETALTTVDANMRDFARQATAREGCALDRLHALMAALHEA